MTTKSDPLSPYQKNGILDEHPRLLALILTLLFLGAGAARLYRIQAPGVLLERDLGSAILARDFFYQHMGTVPQWQKEISAATRANLPLLEPPVTEFLVSILYRAAGQEQLWIARLLTTFFWLAGGVFLYKIARMFISRDGSVVVLAYYLLAPLSILLSRSFQPDALMMLMFLASLFCIVRFFELPSAWRLSVAAALTGLTLLHRPIVLFALFASFIALGTVEQRSWKAVFRQQTLIFIGISLLPSLLYYAYGAAITDGKQAAMSFQPFLLLEKAYWRGWFYLLLDATGITALVAALVGIALLPAGRFLAMLTGLWIGYLFFDLIFAYHIHTHGYYHAQLIPIVALSFGPLVSLISSQLRANSDMRGASFAIVAIMILLLVADLRMVREKLGNEQLVETSVGRTVGQIVNHSDETVFVSKNYGIPLQYYGEFTGSYWPRRVTIPLYQSAEGLEELSVEDRLNALDFFPEYFVVTDLLQYDTHHADLKAYLRTKCSLLSESDDFLIYSGCARKPDIS